MGQQRGHQTQQQAKQGAAQQGRSAQSLSRSEDAVDAVQALLGSRAASRQLRAESQPENQSRPLHQLLQTVAPASPRLQAKPLFRGVSQEWGAATSGLVVQPKLTIGAPNDKYEQEADRVAEQVVQRLHSPEAETPQPNPTLQWETLPDDDEVQMKPLLQRDVDPEEEDELQMKPLLQGRGAVAASSSLETAIQQSRGGGQPLADSIREPMEQAFGGVDFSGVKVHTDAESDRLNQSIYAKAFTTGQDVFFRQGFYEQGSKEGQELLAHELTHVMQQRKGKEERGNGKGGRSLPPGSSFPRMNVGKEARLHESEPGNVLRRRKILYKESEGASEQVAVFTRRKTTEELKGIVKKYGKFNKDLEKQVDEAIDAREYKLEFGIKEGERVSGHHGRVEVTGVNRCVAIKIWLKGGKTEKSATLLGKYVMHSDGTTEEKGDEGSSLGTAKRLNEKMTSDVKGRSYRKVELRVIANGRVAQDHEPILQQLLKGFDEQEVSRKDLSAAGSGTEAYIDINVTGSEKSVDNRHKPDSEYLATTKLGDTGKTRMEIFKELYIGDVSLDKRYMNLDKTKRTKKKLEDAKWQGKVSHIIQPDFTNWGDKEIISYYKAVKAVVESQEQRKKKT